MRLVFALLLAFGMSSSNIVAFSLNTFYQSGKDHALVTHRRKFLTSASSYATPRTLSLYNDVNDCGCNPTIYSGKPVEIARDLNPREAIRYGSIFGIDSEEVQIDHLLENEMLGNSVSIVVFLRSLG